MKNKDRYDLTTLSINASYLTDGCGRKIEGMRYLTVKDGERALLSELVHGQTYKRLAEWLETDDGN